MKHLNGRIIMIKKILIIAFAAGLFAISFLFSGCGLNYYNLAKGSLSEIRYNLFEGESTSYNISLTCGEREKNYVMDGKSGEKVEFGVVFLQPKANVFVTAPSFEITVNQTKYTGDFEQSPFDSSLAGDFGKKVSDTDTITVKITNNGITEEATLTCVSCSFAVKALDALQIAVDEMAEQLLLLTNNGKISVEVYIKIISDTSSAVASKMWFVSFYSAENDEVSAIIDPESGEVIAKKPV